LDVARSGDTIKITVADDGAGFDATDILSTPSRSRGFGLFHIAERLDYIGGALDIDSCPGKGSRFTLTAPLEPQQRAPGMSIDSQQRLP
jgi:signal transduction histidine kinase